MLYGIRPDEQRRLAAAGTRVRAYVPYGVDWYAYFMRRLAERPANVALLPPLARHASPDLKERSRSMDAITRVPAPLNEPVLTYAPGSAERAALEARLAELAAETPRADRDDRRRAADGRGASASTSSSRTGTPPSSGRRRTPRTPTPRPRSRPPRTRRPAWRALSFDDRAAVFLKAADLLAGPWRQTLNAATMLGQSKTALPGRDRRGLRADRLLALQRALRPADPGRAADRQRRASGTASTTARSRASSTRSRRSTSPPSPATCRPPRR